MPLASIGNCVVVSLAGSVTFFTIRWPNFVSVYVQTVVVPGMTFAVIWLAALLVETVAPSGPVQMRSFKDQPLGKVVSVIV